MARRRRNRWGTLAQIDRTTPVGSSAWLIAHPTTKLRKLSAWRGLHRKRTHEEVQRLTKVKPSSNMKLSQMVRHNRPE